MKPVLCMMLKNEAPIIARALDSALPHISGLCVTDTGSDDGTPDICQHWADQHGIPVRIHHERWVDFGTCRTQALNHGRAFARMLGVEWLMLFDADEVVQGELPDMSPGALVDERIDLFKCFGSNPLGIEYARNLLVRVDSGYYYKGATHEALVSDTQSYVYLTRKMRIVEVNDSERRLSGRKVTEDRELLERAIQDDPTDTRSAFYYGRSLMDAQEWPKAEAAMRRRVELSGPHEEETFCAMLYLGICMDKQGKNPMGEWLSAYAFRPTRAEPLVFLATWMTDHEMHPLAALFSDAARKIPLPKQEMLWVEGHCYGWRVQAELAGSLASMGRGWDALAVVDQVLSRPDLPEDDRETLRENREALVEAMEAT